LYHLVTLFSAVTLDTVSTTFNKLYQLRGGATLRHGAAYNIFNGVGSSLVNIAVILYMGTQFEWRWYSALMALALILSSGANYLVCFKAYESGKIVVFGTFMTLGYVFIPCLGGLVFLGESVSPLKWGGILVLTIAVILVGGGKKAAASVQTRKKGLFFCVMGFFFSGLIGWFSKLHQVDVGFEMVSTAIFAMFISMGRIAVFSVFLPFFPAKGKGDASEPFRIPPMAALLAIIAALASGSGYLFTLHNASVLPANVLFPVLTGGGLVLGALAGRLFFHERLTPRIIVGLILAVASTFTFFEKSGESDEKQCVQEDSSNGHYRGWGHGVMPCRDNHVGEDQTATVDGDLRH